MTAISQLKHATNLFKQRVSLAIGGQQSLSDTLAIHALTAKIHSCLLWPGPNDTQALAPTCSRMSWSLSEEYKAVDKYNAPEEEREKAVLPQQSR